MDAHGQETFAECYSTLLPLHFDPAQWAHEVALAHCQQRHWAPLEARGQRGDQLMDAHAQETFAERHWAHEVAFAHC